MDKCKIVIVGASHGGHESAIELLDKYNDVDVTVYEAGDFISFMSCGMHSIEQDFKKDPKHELTITIGSYNYQGTAGMGRGYHIHGSGQFINEGAYFDQMKAQFDWIRAVLVVKIHDVEQKI